MPTPSRLLAIMLLLAGTLPAAAQAPVRNGNEANGRDYQPTQGGVAAAEQHAGVAPPSQQQSRDTSDVEKLNQQLQNAENNDPQVHPNGAGKVNPNR